MPPSGIDAERTPVLPAEAQSALEAVLQSSQFERSDRLQRFLRFICERTLTGESQRINEYLIGSEVFQRGSDYSPSEDSIVRRQAHALRQKLQEYYAQEGQHDPIKIELPVGRYVPVFRRVSQQVRLNAQTDAAVPEIAAPKTEILTTAVPASLLPEPAHVEQRRGFDRRAAVSVIAVALCIGGALGFGLRSFWKPALAFGTSSDERAIAEIWGPWLQPGSSAVICFSNPLTAVIKQFAKPLPPETQPLRYRFHADDEKRVIDAFHLPPGRYVYYSPAINQTKVGEAIAGVHLAVLLSRHNTAVSTTQSRFLSWEDLRKDNLILMGHSEANQWLDPLLKDYPFRLEVTTDEHPRGIYNSKPAAGEPAEYKIAYSHSEADADEEYALVSMIPGIDASHRLLLINGLNAQATQIATEFMTTESSVSQLLQRLRQAAPGHTGPWHFQAVLRTEVYDKVPVRASLEAVRVLPPATPAQ